MDPLAETAERLSAQSRDSYQNPYTSIEWPDALQRPVWCTSPELISLRPLPAWDALSEDQRMELSFWESVNFFSLNIHGEKALMEGLAQRLYQPSLDSVAEYLHHFLDEENKHSIWFGTFCRAYGGKIYPERSVAFPREHAEGEEDFLFFSRIFVFEQIVDRYNLLMGRDERLAPVVRQINANHHAEESRHLHFGRRIVEDLWRRHSGDWPAETVAAVRSHLAGYLTSMWREYYNPDVYRDASLDNPYELARDAWEHPDSRAHRREFSRHAVRALVDLGVWEQEPAL